MVGRSWLGAAALALLALGWAASCGGDDEGGGGSPSGAPSGGSGGSAGGGVSGGNGGAGGDTSTGGTVSCDAAADPCSQCSIVACTGEHCACSTDPACSALVVCQTGCAPEDAPCIQDCWSAYSDGISLAALWLHCSGSSCSTECNLQPLGTCEVCLFENCPEAMNNCLGNPECAALVGCLTTCAEDQTCATQCYFDHSAGIADGTPVGECTSGVCAAACPL